MRVAPVVVMEEAAETETDGAEGQLPVVNVASVEVPGPKEFVAKAWTLYVKAQVSEEMMSLKEPTPKVPFVEVERPYDVVGP